MRNRNRNRLMALIINQELIENRQKIVPADLIQQEKEEEEEEEEDHSVKVDLSQHADLYHHLQRPRVYKILRIIH